MPVDLRHVEIAGMRILGRQQLPSQRMVMHGDSPGATSSSAADRAASAHADERAFGMREPVVSSMIFRAGRG
ncbi:MAG: hypothetical protein M3460_13140 [Actinomycetota bacterium]|nr:hypothetical protein [Actinomycetota bacterium]